MPLLETALTVGAPVVGNAIGGFISNAGSKRAVKQAAKENRAMYEMQRKDALLDYSTQRADALSDWERQNTYDSPVEQMNRYRDAGLNPNLIYGEGVVASSGSGNDVRETNTRASQSGNTPAARYNIDFGMQQFAQNLLLSSQAEVLKSQAAKNYADAGLSNITSDRIMDLLPFDVESRQVDIARTKKDIERITSEIVLNTKEVDIKAQYLVESDARVRKMFQDALIAYLNYENAIQNTEIRRGELSVHQADVGIRKYDAELRAARLKFDKERQQFEDILRKRGVQNDEWGNPFKAIGTLLRGVGSRFGKPHPQRDDNLPLWEFPRPNY